MTTAALNLTLPNGDVRTITAGQTALDVAQEIGPGLAKAALGAKLNGELVDLRQPLEVEGAFEIITGRSPEAGEFIRHSAEHVLADAVKRLWPEVEIDVGRKDHSEKYQYDFRFPRTFTPEDLEKIEQQMRKILKEKSTFQRREVSREEAREIFEARGETLKVDRLGDIPDGAPITIFQHGDFLDLCRGPHVQNLSQIGAVKLLDTSGAYFRGDESNEMLQRVYGTAFGSKKELKAYLENLELARARDHRKLGKELDLFSFHPEAPASPFFHPKGATVYNLLVDYVRSLYRRFGYGEVLTPQILDVEMWKTSGHYDNYAEGMFFISADDREFAVKPMNCPTHCLIYGDARRSYRELPIRYADFGRVHRYERSGVTQGLLRVRSFCQDDGHIFCTEEQIEQEVLGVVEMILELYSTFDFQDIHIGIGTRPKKFVGEVALWDRAEAMLKQALEARGTEYSINEGDGAFYGPKIDFQVSDALGRRWQLGTVQLDFQLPQRFDLTYIGADGDEHRPVLIHRAMLGSLERFLGVLIEHIGGAFPLWLAPVQAAVLPVSDRFLDHAEAVRKELFDAGIRVELDDRGEKLGFKIREAQLQKIPYMLVVGARESESGTVSVRLRTGEELEAMTPAALIERLNGGIESRSKEI
ncbi:MAG: threonine--tRNA ligase [Acidobacteriota bacterium]